MIPLIGIDPGLAGCISILDNGNLINIRMPETFKEISNVLRPYGRGKCSLEQINLRPNFNPFANARMDSLKENFVNIKNALDINEIEYKLVSPVTWQKYHGLILPKGVGEKGIDYRLLKQYENDLIHLKTHLSIETKSANDIIINDNIKYILETSGKEEARKQLNDDFYNFNKLSLKIAIKEAEKDIEKFKAKVKTVRKNRYKEYANSIYIKELIRNNPKPLHLDDLPLNKTLTSKEIKALFKLYGKKPFTLNECDAVLLLLYQTNN